MEIRGIIRKTDSLGRLVIPMEYRKELGIGIHEPLEILLTDSGIWVRKPSKLTPPPVPNLKLD